MDKTTEKEEVKWQIPTTKVKMGRPSKYKKRFCKDIIEFMTEGATIVEWCVSIGQPKSTVDNWIKSHEDFRRAVEVGKQVAEAWWRRNIREVFMYCPTSAVNTPLIMNQVKSRFVSFREGDEGTPEVGLAELLKTLLEKAPN